MLLRLQLQSNYTFQKFVMVLLLIWTSSLVFVHGLGGHPVNTWTSVKAPLASSGFFGRFRSQPERAEQSSATNSSKKVFWPKDLLPSAIPNVRVLVYGYDSDPVGFLGAVNRTNVYHHATDMLAALANERSDNVGIINGVLSVAD
jgi:hypothetical protein